MTAHPDFAAAMWSQDAEQSAIGGALIAPDVLSRLDGQHLRADHFAIDAHQHIWAAIVDLTARRQPVDVITVFERLRDRGADERAGGIQYLNELAGSVVSASNIRTYAKIILQHALRRKIVETADLAQQIAKEPGDADEQLDRVAALFAAIQPLASSAEPVSLGEVLLQRVPHWEGLEAGTLLPGMPTRLPTLDSALGGGLKPGKVIVIAARPSIGKTSVAMQILLNVAADGHPVLLCSQEMQAGDLVDRATANLGRVNLGALTMGRFDGDDWARITEAAETAGPLPFYIDDQPALTLLDIRAKARKVQQRHGLKVLAVDYLQLCASTGRQDNRHHQIEAISRGLKQLAKELGVCVLLLSQVNRDSTRRAEGEPTLADLKESGAIEEDADTVMFLHPKGGLPDGSLLLAAILAKNRQGRRGHIALAFHGATQRWVESTADVSARSPS